MFELMRFTNWLAELAVAAIVVSIFVSGWTAVCIRRAAILTNSRYRMFLRTRWKWLVGYILIAMTSFAFVVGMWVLIGIHVMYFTWR